MERRYYKVHRDWKTKKIQVNSLKPEHASWRHTKKFSKTLIKDIWSLKETMELIFTSPHLNIENRNLKTKWWFEASVFLLVWVTAWSTSSSSLPRSNHPTKKVQGKICVQKVDALRQLGTSHASLWLLRLSTVLPNRRLIGVSPQVKTWSFLWTQGGNPPESPTKRIFPEVLVKGVMHRSVDRSFRGEWHLGKCPCVFWCRLGTLRPGTIRISLLPVIWVSILT